MTKRPINPNVLSRHRRQLRAWLHECNLELGLRRVDDSGSKGAVPVVSSKVTSVSFYPQAGESWPGRIMLLRPVMAEQPWERPFYVLVLNETGPEEYEAAPFSRFSVPALPGEWQTRLRAKPLRVLCLWNTRRLERRVLESAWPAGRLAAGKLKQVLALREGLVRGHNMPAQSGLEVGPPLCHPLDPRWGYVAEEQDAWEDFLEFREPDTLPGASKPGTENSPDYELPPEEQRWAAERPDSGDPEKKGDR